MSMDVIERIWQSVCDDLYVSKSQFVASLNGYAITPEFDADAKMIGAVIHKGPDFHFILFGIKWRLDKAMLSKWPGSLIKQYGYAQTFTPIDDTRQQRFNKRLGFFETRRDENYVYYKIERMKSCQS
jgi:hypothetical protein